MSRHGSWTGALLCAAAVGLAVAGGPGCGKNEGSSKSSAAASSAPPAGAKTTVKGKGKASGNRPPKARLEASPLVGLTGLTGIDLDASFSSDDVDLTDQLARRYDFDGDGRWDTGFTHASRTTHVYEEAGRFRPRLLVVDEGGLADSTVGPEIEIRPPCPAPDFALSDVNPNSRTFHQTMRLSDYHGRPVLAWFVAPTK